MEWNASKINIGASPETWSLEARKNPNMK